MGGVGGRERDEGQWGGEKVSRWRGRKGLRETTLGYTPLPKAGHRAGGHSALVVGMAAG